MKKTITGAILILSLAVLSGCFSNKTSKTSDQAPAQDKGTESSQPQAKKGLLNFFTAGTAVKCSVEDETGKYTVTVKDNKKAKIEGISFAEPTDKEPASSKGTMISDGEWAYMWGDKEKSGLKINVKEAEEQEKKNNPSGGAGSDISSGDWSDWVKQMETSGAKYECDNVVVTDADFVPPSDIKFTDLSEMMKAFGTTQSDTPAQAPGMPANPYEAQPE